MQESESNLKTGTPDGGAAESGPTESLSTTSAQVSPGQGSRQGLELEVDTVEAAIEAVEFAFDYRGDVTLELADGSSVEGYIFDRRKTDATPHCRLLQKSGERQRVVYADVRRVVFSGRDTAAGKSWEAWVRRYNELKAKGLAANRMPDSLDDDDAAQAEQAIKRAKGGAPEGELKRDTPETSDAPKQDESPTGDAT